MDGYDLSARSPTIMHLAFGLPPAERTVGVDIPILVVLADSKPITGAEVWALVQGPNSDIIQTLQLFDDGAHYDGRADDGVYGNLFTRTYEAGAYMVKASGWGVNNYGEEFVRHRTGGFYVLPRVAYIWLDDLTTANAYRNLLQGNGFVVDFVHLDEVAGFNFFPYSLIVIGPETGDGSQWGTSGAVGNILRGGRGLGDGGEGRILSWKENRITDEAHTSRLVHHRSGFVAPVLSPSQSRGHSPGLANHPRGFQLSPLCGQELVPAPHPAANQHAYGDTDSHINSDLDTHTDAERHTNVYGRADGSPQHPDADANVNEYAHPDTDTHHASLPQLGLRGAAGRCLLRAGHERRRD